MSVGRGVPAVCSDHFPSVWSQRTATPKPPRAVNSSCPRSCPACRVSSALRGRCARSRTRSRPPRPPCSLGIRPAIVFEAVCALVPRDDRVSERRVFQGFGGDRFRTPLTRACTAAGIPSFSPHDLRHRRISLLHLAGIPWARIGEHVDHETLPSPRTRTPCSPTRLSSTTPSFWVLAEDGPTQARRPRGGAGGWSCRTGGGTG